jgi:hypothetical protein
MDTLFVIPQQLVHQYWCLAIPHLQRALDAGNGEFTIDQLKLFTAEGNCILLLVLNQEKKCTCALTIQWVTYPNDRVCYITYIGGTTSQEAWNQFVEWVKQNGGTSIQGSTKLKAIERLWRIKWNMKPKYTLMELKL